MAPMLCLLAVAQETTWLQCLRDAALRAGQHRHEVPPLQRWLPDRPNLVCVRLALQVLQSAMHHVRAQR